MPAQDASERNRLRRQAGETETSLPDSDVDTLFDDAELEYEGYTRGVQFKGAVVLHLERLLIQSARGVDYEQGEASEKLSQRFKQIEKMLERAQKKLDRALASEGTASDAGLAVGFGRLRKVPPTQREYPDD